MKKLLIPAAALIALAPLMTSALSMRNEHVASTSSGGITVSEGTLVVTGDQSSTVDLQTVQSGTTGHVDVVTEKDGVVTHESYDIVGGEVSGGGTVPTPDPEPTRDTPRPERPSR